MAGGARIPNTNLGRSPEHVSTKTTSPRVSTFQETLGKAVSSDPKVSFTNLSRVLQSNEASHGQRLDGFRQVANRIISNPTHPYAKIESEVRTAMIDSIAEVMAGSHLKLPTGNV